MNSKGVVLGIAPAWRAFNSTRKIGVITLGNRGFVVRAPRHGVPDTEAAELRTELAAELARWIRGPR